MKSFPVARNIPHVYVAFGLQAESSRKKLQGVFQYEKEHGPWQIHLEEMPSRKSLEDFLLHGGDGVLVSSRKFYFYLKDAKIPVVCLDPPQNLDLPPRHSAVECDNRAIARMAYEHLRERGFRHFAFVYDGFHYPWSVERAAFFEEYVRSDSRNHFYNYGKWSADVQGFAYASCEQAFFQWLKSLPKPVAIFASIDLMAQRVLEACFLLGMDVPQEVTVLGVDDTELICTTTKPTLSSIDPGFELGGYLAAELLDKMMRGKIRKTRTVRYPPHHVTCRHSTQTFLQEDVLIRAALEYIHTHGEKGATVNSTARFLHVSVRKLEKRFREVVGHTVLEEILNVRFKKVLRLLRQTDLKLSEIARQCGLLSETALNRMFLKRYGITMNRFRKEKR
ncbi:MAG: DNA-binding transcriptional regulator [Planctomycetia bacterium]|nr:DNA-binding transcriptional regulator [Planctomycetia bacterium]